jgi:predicted nucleic acid-binding protein
VTTDYVLDELLTLLRVRGEYRRALSLGKSLLNEDIARMKWVRPEDVRRVWEVFEPYRDKAWSFTDCVSRVVMERLGVTTAFAFDDHFRQFATATVVPTSGRKP